jgi:hypothetical protein
MSKVFVGIDPGQNGGLGMLDSRGGFLACWRWNQKDPLYLYNKLLLFRDLIGEVYLELIQTFPQKEKGIITRNQATLVNWGIWQGWLMAAGLPFLIISPLTWQACHNLTGWASKLEKNIKTHSPLTLARAKWPVAPLEHKVDDGKAVALLLADLSCRDHQKGINRRALQEVAAKKKQTKKKALRQARKASKPLPIGA